MRIFHGADGALRAADPKSFVGPAETKLLASSEDGTPVHVYEVQFNEGARTNWHIHSGAQWLLVVSGRIRVQCWGESAHEVVAGDAVVISPGEKHWHGAAAGHRGVHLAVNVNLETEWLEQVSDADYRATV